MNIGLAQLNPTVGDLAGNTRKIIDSCRALEKRGATIVLTPELVLGPDHDPVGPLEIADRRALAQEFGVGDNRELMRRAGLADDPLNLVPGADRDGRLGHDHCIA